MTDIQIDQDLVAGVDVGGTKVHIADTRSGTIHRYSTGGHEDLYEILEDYFEKTGARPVKMVVVMAGPRDDESGSIKLTNSHWPAFEPKEAEKRYPGSTFQTLNDMIGTTAGMLTEKGIDLVELKPGTPAQNGTKLVVTLSTGIGVAAAAWDEHTKRYVFIAGEGGHISFQPKNDAEHAYLKYLQDRYTHADAEIAFSGKHGIENIVNHTLEAHEAPGLRAAVERARELGNPTGEVLREFALEGSGEDQAVAHRILDNLGNMLGSTIRDLAVTFKSTGGVYLTGTMSLRLGEYFAGKSAFTERFIHPGATHDEWLEKVPIYLLSDPNIGVRGALALAQEQ